MFIENFLAGYLGATMACIMLAIDRFFEILFPKLAIRLFGGNMIYFWMMIPLAYIVFTLTQIPAFYSIKSQAFYYDPYYGTPGFEGNPYVSFCVQMGWGSGIGKGAGGPPSGHILKKSLIIRGSILHSRVKY
jgi:hypothetical protein